MYDLLPRCNGIAGYKEVKGAGQQHVRFVVPEDSEHIGGLAADGWRPAPIVSDRRKSVC